MSDHKETMTTCELRLKAAEIIEQRGHRKNHYGTSSGPVCLLGAIHEAAGFLPTQDSDAMDRRMPVVYAMGFVSSYEAKVWNDVKGRTKAEVLARLRDGCETKSGIESGGAQ